MTQFLAIDIGGTYIKYALLDNQGRLSKHGKVHTPFNQNDAIIKQVKEIATNFQGQLELRGIGISTAGIVDSDQGKIVYAGPTIHDYKGTNFKQALATFNVPIHVENDVNAALLGEQWQGAGQECDNIYCITLGTGIGGAYYNNGLISGTHFQGNSVGYMLFDPKTDTNYETRASTSALDTRIKTQLGKNWTAQSVFKHAQNGKQVYVDLLEGWASDIAAGLAQIILLIDPKLIIIGGGVSQQGEFLLQMIEKHIKIFLPNAFMKTEIKIAQLYNNASLYGAVYPLIE